MDGDAGYNRIQSEQLESNCIFKKKFHDNKLELEIIENSRDSIKIKLINLNYQNDQRNKLKLILILLLSYCIYIAILRRQIYIDATFFIALLIIIYNIINLTKEDSLAFYGGLALQTSTLYFMNRLSTKFIPSNLIFDVVLNEVIQRLKIKYILLARLNSKNSENKNIILLTSLNPGIDCLQIIYKHLRRKIM